MLASASPRRLEMLHSAGLSPVVTPADVDETPLPGEEPEAYVVRVALDKATAVSGGDGSRDGTVVLAADTAVVLDGVILGKPDDSDHAQRMLSALSGRTHVVMTGVVVIDADGTQRSTIVRTTVAMRPLAAAEIRAYAASGEPLDKAGGYAIQGGAAAFVERADGSWTNVVGLPLDETVALLEQAGIRPVRGAADMEWRRAGNG